MLAQDASHAVLKLADFGSYHELEAGSTLSHDVSTIRGSPYWMSPEHVHVFCSCNMPVNPDLLMLSCDTCKDWFHPHCIGMKDSEAQKWQGPYVCPECVKKTR